MMNLKQIQKEVWQNKLNKGFKKNQIPIVFIFFF